MKKVLFICSQPFFEWRGSPIRVGFDLQALQDAGYKTYFLTLPYGRDRKINNVQIIRCFKLPFVKAIPIGPSLPKLIYDMVHFFYGICILLKDRDVKFIHGVEDSGIPALLLSWIFRKKLIFEKHSDPSSYKENKGFVKNIILTVYQFVEAIIIKNSDLVIGTGDELVKQASSVKNNLNSYSIPDIPSSLSDGSDQEAEDIRKKIKISPEKKVACYVGSFAVYQGIDLLFDSIPIAVNKDRNIVFMIIGGKEEEIKERKKQLQKANCLENVFFAGFVNPDELPSYLKAADILLSPRISGRNSPLKVLDYLKARRAVVATNIDANNQILNSENSILVEPKADEMGNAIVKLSVDNNKREQLAAEGSKLIEGRYNFNYFKEKLAEAYKSLY